MHEECDSLCGRRWKGSGVEEGEKERGMGIEEKGLSQLSLSCFPFTLFYQKFRRPNYLGKLGTITIIQWRSNFQFCCLVNTSCTKRRNVQVLGLLFGKLTFQYGSCNFSSNTKVRPASFNGDKMICFLDRVFNALCVHWADGTEVNHLYINNTNSYNFLYWCIAKCTLFKCQCI